MSDYSIRGGVLDENGDALLLQARKRRGTLFSIRGFLPPLPETKREETGDKTKKGGERKNGGGGVKHTTASSRLPYGGCL